VLASNKSGERQTDPDQLAMAASQVLVHRNSSSSASSKERLRQEFASRRPLNVINQECAI
jgi:hypothetical protein